MISRPKKPVCAINERTAGVITPKSSAINGKGPNCLYASANNEKPTLNDQAPSLALLLLGIDQNDSKPMK